MDLIIIDDVVMSEDKYSITVTVNNRMINFFNNSSREWVNIDVFSRIKTQRCKAMYLMILTLKFPKEKSFRISVEDIENRLCANIEVMESKISSKELKSQSNRIIRNTLKELVRLQIVSGFDFNLKSKSILFIKSNSLPIELFLN
ncbi:hypothetical protein [Shewanella mangrovisoli]|uniref:hypothetical protein n=1 Tax=Shewanella mangrovisoli TaxID=2864211 RepID=UPI00370A7061